MAKPKNKKAKATDPDRFLFPQKDAAAMFSISVSALRKWPVAPAERRGRLALYDIRELIAHRIERAEGVDTTAVEAERRYKIARAEKEEIFVAERRAELIDAGAAEKAWGDLVTAFTSRMLSLPTSLSPELALMDKAAEIQKALAAVVDDALSELKGYDPGTETAKGNSRRGRKSDPAA